MFSKRKKFVATSILLPLGFLGIQLANNAYRLSFIAALAILTVALFVWTLEEGLGKNFTLMTLILPFFFTIGVGLFWFLIPATLFVRIPIIILYGIGIYTLSLTMNIFTVAAIRTIALLRAAKGVGFVFTLATFFLIFNAILSVRLGLVTTSLLTILVSFPLFYQGLWSSSLTLEFKKQLLIKSSIYALVIGEIALLLYFWPVTVIVGSLFLTVSSYVLLGLGQAWVEARLFTQTIREYLVVGILVLISMFLATRWG